MKWWDGDKVKQIYTPSIQELETISSKFNDHNDWSKKCFSEFKENLKEHMRTIQNNKCCYCKKELFHDIGEVDIEHILSKSKFPTFTFYPLNLALSCRSCNTKKGSKNVLVKNQISEYPVHGNAYSIVHPNIDNFNEHLAINEGYVFEALTSKGSHTITVCELFRLKEVMKRNNAHKMRELEQTQQKLDEAITENSLLKELMARVSVLEEERNARKS